MAKAIVWERVRIEFLTRLTNSVNGNPAYRVGYRVAAEVDGTGTGYVPITVTRTSSDSSCAYGLGSNKGMREGDTVDVTLTRAGRIDRVRTLDGMPA